MASNLTPVHEPMQFVPSLMNWAVRDGPGQLAV
jgi:hypothetical protein